MKRAFIDQIMLGLFLFVSLIALGATVNDEMQARTKSINLEKITHRTAKALSKHYMYNTSINDAEIVANSILQSTKLGQELLSKNNISFIWSDIDFDGSPDAVTSRISGYVQDNFWYRLLGTDTFSLPTVEASYYILKEESDITSIHIKYGGSNAGYFNMIGTYELDANNCIINTSLVLANKNDYDVGDDLGSYTNLSTKFFIIADGYNQYGGNISESDPINITGCLDSEDSPTVTLNGVTDAAPIYFQDTAFNEDNGYDHMHEVAKTYFDDYEEFISTPISECTRYRYGECTRYKNRDATWEDWDSYATVQGIDYQNDPNDEYIITMEDLPDGGDKDFNDINLDTTKVRTPRVPSSEDLENANVLE